MTPSYEQAATLLRALQDHHINQACDPRHAQLMGHPAYRAGYLAATDSLIELEAITDELMMREAAK